MKVKDIASALNLSPATVSLALNNKPGVSSKTEEKIMNYIKKNGYSVKSPKKNPLSDSRNIRFIIYKKHGKVVSDTSFFTQLIEGIESETRKNGYNLIISYIYKFKDNMEVIDYLIKNPPDGIIILATEMSREDLKVFDKIAAPKVLLDNCFEEEKIDSIVINNEHGAYAATEHLIKMGHTKIGYLHSSVIINNFLKRNQGYIRALNSYNIKFDESMVFNLESTIEGAYRDMAEILSKNPKMPTAFFADNDIIALGAIKAMKEFKIRIPEDISIIGFDDMPFCMLNEPTLSTMKVFKQRMGKIVVDRLIEKIEDNVPEFVKIEVGTELVQRSSVIKRVSGTQS